MMCAGFEWLFRLIQEPRRLWKRYFDIVPAFIGLSLLQELHLRSFPLESPSTHLST